VSTSTPPAVTITLATATDERLVIGVSGEIDHATATGMHDQILALLLARADRGAVDLLLDFNDVGFCDSSGMSALLGIWRCLHARSGTLTITAAPANIVKALRMGGLDHLITVRPI
jgi:anti-sigma B factor antagonist